MIIIDLDWGIGKWLVFFYLLMRLDMTWRWLFMIYSSGALVRKNGCSFGK